MDIKLLLWDWRFILVTILGVAVYAVADWKNFKILVIQAIAVAKSKAKDGVLNGGQAQEDWVVDKVYDVMPARIKLFVNKELLRKIVYKAYHITKDLLDDGKLNESVLDQIVEQVVASDKVQEAVEAVASAEIESNVVATKEANVAEIIQESTVILGILPEETKSETIEKIEEVLAK